MPPPDRPAMHLVPPIQKSRWEKQNMVLLPTGDVLRVVEI
jgi:hypothetical protein